LGSRYNS